jgi:dolichyl-phosphate beta-glucosyltransferase
MLSIVIPAYNEEKRLEATLKSIKKHMKGTYEIIVVDDGSTDKTSEIALKNHVTLVKNHKNKGKGFSVKRGFLEAKYEYVLFSDADMATPIEEVDNMINTIKHADIVMASRNLKDSKILTKQPYYRIVLGKIFPLIVRLLLLPGIKDTQCGFKLYRKEVAKSIALVQKMNGFAFDVEQLYIAKRKGCVIKEVPVQWIDQKGSKVDPIKDSIRMLRDIIKIKMNAIKGIYH